MKYIAGLFISIFLLVGCGSDEQEVKAGKHGMMGSDTPQYTAVLFLRAVYNEDNLTKVVELSTPRYGRILKGYHTNNNVQRQAFNLRLDTMETEPVSGGSLLSNDRLEKAEIEMKISGHYNGDKIYELKTLTMIKVKGDWKVQEVKNTVQ